MPINSTYIFNHHIYTAENLFTGKEWLSNQAILCKEDIIEQIVPIQDLPKEAIIQEKFTSITAGFIDIQVYGARERLFSEYPDTETLEAMYEDGASTGTYWFLPTVATNNSETVDACIIAVKEYISKGGKGCLGLHLEGPWLNPLKRGAHVQSLMHAPTYKEVQELLKKGGEVIKMITLAPEVCSAPIIQLLTDAGIIVSAGHTNATYAEAITGFNTGVQSATHLYNAMSGLHHRDPGMVGAIFHKKIFASIIPDGIHVSFAAVEIAKQQLNEKLFIITDAVTTTHKGHYRHQPAGNYYQCNNTLSGSALTMRKGIENLIKHCNIEAMEAIRMATLYPATVLRMENTIGSIAVGKQAYFAQWENNRCLSLPHGQH
jgi:N-acetylglucosamine-6-phosphate deacetylase